MNILVKGNGADVLFGSITYKKGGVRIKGKAIGVYHVNDIQAGLPPYSVKADVFQMWKRLGDCSSKNKSISVIKNGVTQTFNFSDNYLITQ